MKKTILFVVAILFASLFAKSQYVDKFTYLDSTQNAVVNGLKETSIYDKYQYEIENIENIDKETTKVIFKVKKSETKRFSWIECTFKNNKCISTTYKNPIEDIGFMFYILAQDFYFSKDAKTLTHKKLNIIGLIDYDFEQQFYSVKYHRK